MEWLILGLILLLIWEPRIWSTSKHWLLDEEEVGWHTSMHAISRWHTMDWLEEASLLTFARPVHADRLHFFRGRLSAESGNEYAGVQIQGKRTLQLGEPLEIRLQAVGLDSVLVQMEFQGEQRHVIVEQGSEMVARFMPKQIGQATLQLGFKAEQFEDAGVWAAHIVPARTLQLLAIEHSPSFEMQTLTALLEQGNHGYVRWIHLGKGVQRVVSSPQTKISVPTGNVLSKRLLDAADVLFPDALTWSGWSAQEWSRINTAVKEGLGLVLSVASQEEYEFLQKKIQATLPDLNRTVDEHEVLLDWHTNNAAPVSMLINGLNFDRSDHSSEVVVWDAYERAKAVVMPFGKGRIMVMTPMPLASLMRRGEAEVYAQLWMEVLGKVARPLTQPQIILPSTPIWRGELTRFTLLNDAQAQEVIVHHEQEMQRITLQKQGNQTAQGTWFPQYAGWTELKTDSGTSMMVYVNDKEEFMATRTLRNMLDTKLAARQITTQTPGRRSIPEPIVFSMLIIGMMYVWWRDRVE